MLHNSAFDEYKFYFFINNNKLKKTNEIIDLQKKYKFQICFYNYFIKNFIF